MIQETTTFTCTRCGSINIVRKGKNKCGYPQYHCKDCGAYRVLKPKTKSPAQCQQTILKACQERIRLRGLERVFGGHRQTVARWIEHQMVPLPLLVETLLPAQAQEVLELDELWSFVASKAQKRWLWVALCRRTRQIVSFFLGERDTTRCQQVWQRIPLAYSTCPRFTDAWQGYPDGLPTAQHHPVGKETGETAHIERLNNTLRQRLAR
jgi:IS1 family transposase/DNA-directed RNA polymerase subunit RPC12/RpoP